MGNKYFTLSFDDGGGQDVRFIKMLDSYGLKGTFNLNSAPFGGGKIEDFATGKPLVFTDESRRYVTETYKNHEVASHGIHHANLPYITDEQIVWQVCDDIKNLEMLSKQKVIGFAYPGGLYDERSLKVLREKTPLKYARTVCDTLDFKPPEDFLQWHPTVLFDREETLELADRFLMEKPGDEDMIFCVWGHSYMFDMADLWGKVDELCRKMSGHDDIKYVTNGEYYRIRTGK